MFRRRSLHVLQPLTRDEGSQMVDVFLKVDECRTTNGDEAIAKPCSSAGLFSEQRFGQGLATDVLLHTLDSLVGNMPH